MTQRKLTIGDRCRVYHRSTFTGKVDTISPDGCIGVIEDGFYSQHSESPFHPKQCRRLRPRKCEKKLYICIVPESKRIISREELARAWDSEIVGKHPCYYPMVSMASEPFERFVKALGFPREKK